MFFIKYSRTIGIGALASQWNCLLDHFESVYNGPNDTLNYGEEHGKYYYDNPSHFLPTRAVTQNSKGDVITTVTGVCAVSIEEGGDIGELRFYPANTQMPSSTFDPLTSMISLCGINSHTNGYEYDGLERLKDVKCQDGNIIKTIDYHYKGQQ